MSRRDTLWDYCLRHNLLVPGRAVLVGVSGGPDSLCLLDQLHRLAAEHDFPLAVAHFDHGLRPESADEAAFVRAEAQARGRLFFTERADTAAFAAQNKLSTEAAARQLRYAFLARAARQAGAGTVAVAHTADDQAETVLMHFLRGSGLAGLQGMRPNSLIQGMVPAEGEVAEGRAPNASPLTLIRPLLATTRQEVEKYCAEHGLQPRHDPSNADLHYTRNRLRHVVLPALEQENPNIRATLARTAEVLAGEYEVVENAVALSWRVTVTPEAQWPNQVRYNGGLLASSLGERLALLRRGAQVLLGDTRDLDYEPLAEAAHFIRRARPGQSVEVARGLRLINEAGVFILFLGELPLPDYPLLLDADGRLPAGWRLVSEEANNAEVPLDAWEVLVSTAALTEPPQVRARRPGDRFQPFGMGGQHVKLSDFFINAKIAAQARDRWPVVVSGDAVVWLPGLRLDERFRVQFMATGRTRLRFVFERPDEH